MNTAIITCHFNPAGYTRPVELAREFIGRVHRERAPLAMVELVFPDQPGARGMTDIEFAIAAIRRDGGQVIHHKVIADRRDHTLFQKEALLNKAARLALQQWPTLATLAWLDADLVYPREGWVRMIGQSVTGQRPIAQAFDLAQWEDRDGGITLERHGCVAADQPDSRRAHPGFAWAAARSFWDRGPGLFPFGITGGGDTLMARSIMGYQRPQYTLHRDLGEHLYRWHIGAHAWLAGRSVHAVPLTVRHRWHGSLRHRRYRERAQVLAELQPRHHLIYDARAGLVRWTPSAPEWMRAWLADYFAGRGEDDPAPIDTPA